MADQQKAIYGVLNGAIFNDLERPQTWFSMSRHSLTLNISQTATDTATVTTESERETAPKFSNGTNAMILSDL